MEIHNRAPYLLYLKGLANENKVIKISDVNNRNNGILNKLEEEKLIVYRPLNQIFITEKGYEVIKEFIEEEMSFNLPGIPIVLVMCSSIILAGLGVLKIIVETIKK